MFRQTHLLIRMRCRAVANRLSSVSRMHWLRLISGLGFATFGLIWLGDRCASLLLRIPQEVATPGLTRTLVAGHGALEAAFWVSAIGAAVLSFRVMESLFRREDARVLEALPIQPVARFVDRLLLGLWESIWVSVCVATFFVPLAWHNAVYGRRLDTAPCPPLSKVPVERQGLQHSPLLHGGPGQPHGQARERRGARARLQIRG